MLNAHVGVSRHCGRASIDFSAGLKRTPQRFKRCLCDANGPATFPLNSAQLSHLTGPPAWQPVWKTATFHAADRVTAVFILTPETYYRVVGELESTDSLDAEFGLQSVPHLIERCLNSVDRVRFLNDRIESNCQAGIGYG